MRVTAIIVSYNAADQLEACVSSLDAQDHQDLELLVVDNASRDGTVGVLDALERRAWRHPLRVVRSPRNLGFSGAVNLGCRASDADAVLLANVDIVADPGLCGALVAALEADPSVGSAQPRLRRVVPAPDGRDVLDTTGHVATRARLFRNRDEGEVDVGQRAEGGDVFGVSGALALHRRAMLDDVAWRDGRDGPEWLTEDLFAFFEDVELDWRARRMGWRARYVPQATGEHERGGAGPRRTPRVEALNFANRLLVVAACDDRRRLVRAAPLVAATTLLKLVDLAVGAPRAVPAALARLGRGWRGALARRVELDRRARVPAAAVVDEWFEPFALRPWVATWWRRVTGRQLGVAGRR